MARFDVYKYDSKSVPYLVDVQAELLTDLQTCVVIPLVPEKNAKNEALPKLKPVIQIKGQSYILMTTDLGTVARKTLGELVTNIEAAHRQDVTDALDFLFQGF